MQLLSEHHKLVAGSRGVPTVALSTRPNCGCVTIARSIYNPSVKLSVWLTCCLSEVYVLLQVSLLACVGVKSECACYCCCQCLPAHMNV